MTVTLYDRDGSASGEVDLPAVFEERVRPDLIKKAVDVARANAAQPYGTDPRAGKKHSTESVGPGQGISRVPRLKQGQEAALAPGVRGGRRAHPPTADKDIEESINEKTRRKANRAALAAITDIGRVRERGHEVPDDLDVPIVVEDGFLDLYKTHQVQSFLETLGLADELARAEDRTVRAGRGTTRGRKYRTPRTVLIVLHDDGDVRYAARNLPGVDVVQADNVSAMHLAPGGDPGRLVVFTASALEVLG